jgi:hypothetical protein
MNERATRLDRAAGEASDRSAGLTLRATRDQPWSARAARAVIPWQGTLMPVAGTVDETLQSFEVVGDRLRALGRGQVFQAAQVVIREYCRFEWVSDPDDVSIVYAIEARTVPAGCWWMPLAFPRTRRSARF